jgi:hypothetical protein
MSLPARTPPSKTHSKKSPIRPTALQPSPIMKRACVRR